MSGLRARLKGRRGDREIDAEIEAPAGEVTALTGPSGAGKSTLLRAAAGLERLGGRVEVGGELWQDDRLFVAPHRRSVGMVFQHGALLPHLSVEANIRYGWRRARRSEAELDRAVALMGVETLLARAPERLSGGERRRVALARALARGPTLLLLDEPLAGLDAPARAELLPELRTVLTRLAIPVIYVSHDGAEVAQLADRVLRMREGRIVGSADPPSSDALAGLAPGEVARLAKAALRAGLR